MKNLNDPDRDPVYGDYRNDTTRCRECGEPATDTFESGDPNDEPIHLCAKHKKWSEDLVLLLSADPKFAASFEAAVNEAERENLN